MGAIKENSYTLEETDLFYVARAFAHPARVKMITELLVERSYRNIDLAKILDMAPSSIKKHIDMMKDAEFVSINYFFHYYDVSLNAKGRRWSELFLNGHKAT